VLVFLFLVARFWHPVYGFTSFLQLDSSKDSTKIAAFRTMPVYVYRDTGGYDGLYYAQIAYHPSLAAAELRPAVDGLAYRGRRILAPLLAWLLALGRPVWIVHAYSLLNVAAWLLLAFWLWQLLSVGDARGWTAWAGVLFSAGALSSVRLALTDLVALTLLAGALLAEERGRSRAALGALAAAGLARETSLAGISGLWKRPWLSGRNVARTLIAVAPLALWMGYIHWRIERGEFGAGKLSWPVTGLVEKWIESVASVRTESDWLLAWTTLLATLGLTVQAAFFLMHPRLQDRWWRVGAAYTVVLLCLGTPVWEGFPGAATRVLLPLTLAFNVLVDRTRAPAWWLLAGNLTVAAGLLTMRDVPKDRMELAAVRGHGRACVATLGEGWYGRERDARHAWVWSRGPATITLEAWPKAAQVPRLEFAARSLVPRTVVLSQAGRELWRGTVGTELTSRQSVPIPLKDGRGTIEFTTNVPAVREGPNPDARQLAFSLHDPRLVVPSP